MGTRTIVDVLIANQRLYNSQRNHALLNGARSSTEKADVIIRELSRFAE